jgi:hypothetical protein
LIASGVVSGETLGSNVQTLVVQIHPGRLTSFSPATISELITVEAPPGLIVKSDADERFEPTRSINVTFQTGDIKSLWSLVRERLHELGIEKSSIVVCTGQRGWHDYLQLHHYDPAEPLDVLHDN